MIVFDVLLKLWLFAPWFVLAFLAFKFYQFWNAGFAKCDVDARNKWVLVTGAASGLGRATALAILRYGGNVYAADVNEAALKEAFAGYDESRVRIVKLDVTDGAAVKAMAARCAETGLYGVVNSAGVAKAPGQPTTVKAAPEMDIDREVLPVLQINTVGTMRVNASVFDLVFQSRGVYVNIASAAGRVATPGFSTYNTSKFAVVGYSGAMRRELAPYGIRVVCIEPGFARTPLLDVALKERIDLSETRLREKTFAGRDSAERTFREWGGESMQTADDVAARIMAALFASAFVPPHLIVDNARQYLTYHILSFIPHHWVDVVVAAKLERDAAKAAKASRQ